MTPPISVEFSGRFTPYVRMTRRSKYVNPQAMKYNANQVEIKHAFKKQLKDKGHRVDDFPIFKRGTPLRAMVLISMSGRLHTQDADNQLKAIFDAAQGFVFEDDRWIDSFALERSLGKLDIFELIVTEHPPTPRQAGGKAVENGEDGAHG